MEKIKKVLLVIADCEEVLNGFSDIRELEQIVAPCYRKKYREHKIDSEAKQELITGYLLRYYFGVERDDQLRIREYGKPYLTDGTAYFNVSHSGRYCVLAIAYDEVGVDIERKLKFQEAVVKKVFPERERHYLMNCKEADPDMEYTRIWTKYEAVLKAVGTGFDGDWKNRKVEDFHVETYRFDDYYIACATKGKACIEIKHFRENCSSNERVQKIE